VSIDWKRYDALLRSDDPEQRREALRELITQGLAQLSEKQIREAARKRLNLLYELIVRAHLRDRIVGRAVALAMAGVLQKAWPDVEHVLMHPKEIVDAMGEKGRVFREDPEAAEWLNEQMEDIYLFPEGPDVGRAVCVLRAAHKLRRPLREEEGDLGQGQQDPHLPDARPVRRRGDAEVRGVQEVSGGEGREGAAG
jgi:hypothetical protein